MSVVTKAKLNLKEGTIELEGSEAFVTKYLEIFRKEMEEVKFPTTVTEKVSRKAKVKKPREIGRKKKAPVTFAPISLDLKQNENKPALRTFANEKIPTTYTEKLTVFAYYLKHHLNLEKMKAGHVVSCCKEIRSRVPKNITQMFYNIQQHKGWLDVGEKGEYATITTQGENFVEYDLPRKKDVKKSQTTT